MGFTENDASHSLPWSQAPPLLGGGLSGFVLYGFDYLLFLQWSMHNIKFTILTMFISVQFSGTEDAHIVVQPSPPSIHRTFSSAYTETLYFVKGFPSLLPHTLATSIFLWFCFIV